MAGSFDTSLKQLLGEFAADWVRLLTGLVGLPGAGAVEPLDVDLSTVQPTVDKVFRLGPPAAGLLHLEPQSSWDGEFPGRLLLYNVLLERRFGGPVHTVALLLRREAGPPGVTGELVRVGGDGREYLRFRYSTIRVWELSADELLGAGLGVTPLGLLTDDARGRLPEVTARFATRAEQESASADAASRLVTCGFLLMGLLYEPDVADVVFREARKMKDSSTYQAILREGREAGLQEGLRQGLREGIREGLREGREEERKEWLGCLATSLIDLLRDKFPNAVPPALEDRIRATTDRSRLQAALRQVLQIQSPDQLQL